LACGPAQREADRAVFAWTLRRRFQSGIVAGVPARAQDGASSLVRLGGDDRALGARRLVAGTGALRLLRRSDGAALDVAGLGAPDRRGFRAHGPGARLHSAPGAG